MLTICNKCRDTKQIRLRIDNPQNLKINKYSIKQEASIKIEPVCEECGTPAKINTFSLQRMIETRDFIPEKKAKTSKLKCHACDSNQEVKLDKKSNPRCLRCGGIVKISDFMLKAMKNELKLFMTDEELDKFGLK